MCKICTYSCYYALLLFINCAGIKCLQEVDLNKSSPSCGIQNISEEFDVTYHTSTILSEYIVSFHNYYTERTRRQFLNAALKGANASQWRIQPRVNPASSYPSDFDVIYLDVSLNSIRKHPAIKSVTPHRFVKRSLSYKPERSPQGSYELPLELTDEIYEKSDLLNKIYGNPTQFKSVNRNNSLENRQFTRRLLRAFPRQITTILRANVLWDLGITGKGVKVAVFDTGLAKRHPHFKRVKERTNWTNEKSLDDGVSHGTFVAGVIASAKECLGFAPDAELHVYRVFTNTQVSYTSWFLDAFNYAILKKINILNLSIGGPDFLDYPFVEKVLELSANKVIMVSAIGNDGPLYGTLNNPGDQSDVIGVGGINFEENVAKFSSRGMTTWELPRGYGRLKPDIVTYGSQVKGSNTKGGCRSLSGTSVASPVVAGAVTLIASGVINNLDIVNPASMKQVLLEGSSRLSDNNMFEQGHGKLNILRSMELLANYVPKVTLSPPYVDFSESYMWPYSSQPLYCKSIPLIVNVTILNGISVTGYVTKEPTWHPYIKNDSSFLKVSITTSHILWPWSGWMAVYLAVNDNGCDFEGIASGYIQLLVENQLPSNENKSTSVVNFPISVKIIPKPPRHKRILWDQYHSLRYPPGYIPRDNLKIKSDPLDWKADHIHTNFRNMYNHLRSSGYYVDVLRGSFMCFNASDYGTVLIVDPEEEYFDEEIIKLQNDVYSNDLSVIVFADWYNTTVMKKIKFFDENTRQWWIPDTGGANIPALNELLKSFGVSFGDFVAEGYYSMGDHNMYYASGSVIVEFPDTEESVIVGANLYDQGLQIIKNIDSDLTDKSLVPILGLLQARQQFRHVYPQDQSHNQLAQSIYEDNILEQTDTYVGQTLERNPILNKRILLKSDAGDEANKLDQNTEANYIKPSNGMKHTNKIKSEGRIAVFGDSNCLDSTHIEKPCYWLLDALLEFTMNSHVPSLLQDLKKKSNIKFNGKHRLPLRLATSSLHIYSKVIDSDNMFKKRKVEKCEELRWADENAIQMQYDKLFFGKDYIRNYEDINKRFLRKLESEKAIVLFRNTSDVGSKTGDEKTLYDSSAIFIPVLNYRENIANESFSYSIIFIMILTILVLGFFIYCLKRRKLKKVSRGIL